MYAPMHAASRPAPTHVFERPGYRVWVDLLGPSSGAVAFLIVAVVILKGTVSLGGLLVNLPAAMVFGFFGVLMALGFVATIRRGVTRAILEVGPAGMWTPEMGFLGWREIGEVRLERVRGPGRDSLADYSRIGIVPRDATRIGRVHRSPVYRMYAGYAWLIRRMAPSAGLQDPDSLAPFGVYAYELDSSIGAVVDAIREFHAVRMPDGSVPAGGA